ncbi:uncharacterized protein VTP21DRAFT_4832 [Calcarisporiella thermophila]|uniref:uncharacterized protein n=1 Tax=Calcarisporiella thermophila TaxID=911321 RepID=UPI00374383A8
MLAVSSVTELPKSPRPPAPINSTICHAALRCNPMSPSHHQHANTIHHPANSISTLLQRSSPSAPLNKPSVSVERRNESCKVEVNKGNEKIEGNQTNVVGCLRLFPAQECFLPQTNVSSSPTLQKIPLASIPDSYAPPLPQPPQNSFYYPERSDISLNDNYDQTALSNIFYNTCSPRDLLGHTLHPEFVQKYELGQELGSGGFGFVLAARRISDSCEVAVKFITRDRVPSRNWIWDPTLCVEVPIEIFVLQRVEHPAIVKYLDSYWDDRFFYLVMELHGKTWSSPHSGTLESRSYGNDAVPTEEVQPVFMERRGSCDLFECIEQHRHFPEHQARHIFRQIVECVAYLDSVGVCHRDLKDENIVIDAALRVKLVDFGSAISFTPSSHPFNKQKMWLDRFYGTVEYASPEILLGQKYYAPAAEVWALGVLLYLLLHGQPPFQDPYQAVYEPYDKRKAVSESCENLLLRMLEKRPEKRVTVKEVLLHPWLAEDETPAELIEL